MSWLETVNAQIGQETMPAQIHTCEDDSMIGSNNRGSALQEQVERTGTRLEVLCRAAVAVDSLEELTSYYIRPRPEDSMDSECTRICSFTEID